MQLPLLYFSDISLLLVVGAIILLITEELTSPHYGASNLNINKKKLLKAAVATSVVFLTALGIQIAFTIINS